ncbi:MBL fold metallo-hydrolase [Ruminococcaceae bacterium OttesenSCG-928-I18]|nr:MBL fold metallo-hydrolase [Ruminococcaceae bacterium OttesenSCG-928-I18]
MARFITLCSGSSGNAAVVEEEGAYLLIDIGVSCRATLTALSQLGLTQSGLQGLLVTHEHIDHVRGLEVFLRRVQPPLFASAATLDILWETDKLPAAAELVAVDGRSVEVNGFQVAGFATSHDAAGCCGFLVTTPRGATMALATDLGVLTEQVFRNFQKAQLVAIEANYDPEMLRTGPYPPYLKRRIKSQHGHLSNEDSAAAVAALVAGGCRRVALCHLSVDNNHPDLVKKALDMAFAASGHPCPAGCEIQIAPRYTPGRWMEFGPAER